MKIFVNGYWALNLGDDLFLKILCERYPNIKFETNIKEKYSKPFNNISNLKMNYLPDDRNLPIRYIKKISIFLKSVFRLKNSFSILTFKRIILVKNSIDAYVEIGGSIFMIGLGENVKKSLRFQQRMRIEQKVKNYFVIGSNFGPFYNKNQINDYSIFFSKVNDICFRDKYSKDLFPTLDNVRFEADVILSLDVSNYDISRSEYILISIIDLEIKNDNGLNISKESIELYRNKMIEIVEYYIIKGKKVVLFSFCDFQGDRLISECILETLMRDNFRNVEVYSHQSIEESLKVFSEAEKVIATRFHAMILGWIFKKPTLSIPYSEKTINVINSSAPNQSYVRYVDINSINTKEIESLFTTIDSNTLYDLKESSIRQFQSLDNFINGEFRNV